MIEAQPSGKPLLNFNGVSSRDSAIRNFGPNSTKSSNFVNPVCRPEPGNRSGAGVGPYMEPFIMHGWQEIRMLITARVGTSVTVYKPRVVSKSPIIQSDEPLTLTSAGS
jgi:hypothetical protein